MSYKKINERQFNRKHIDNYIRQEIFENPENNLLPEVNQAVELPTTGLNKNIICVRLQDCCSLNKWIYIA